ncbi:MAG: hypothetical protein CMQ40_10880 [Gammaproteobacteria bacterium]|nr:hypothetical protein [Gammaproteobacteria bacterium]
MTKKTSDNPLDNYFAVERSMVECPAYRSLSLVAREVLRALQYRCRPWSQNGRVRGGVQDLCEEVGIADLKTLRQGLKDLEARGFIVETFCPKKGQKLVKRWALTCYPIDGAPQPLRSYLLWTPKRKDFQLPTAPKYNPVDDEFIYVSSGKKKPVEKEEEHPVDQIAPKGIESYRLSRPAVRVDEKEEELQF